MSYAVKEIFLTLQGEGAQAGRVAVFCRFAPGWRRRHSRRSRAISSTGCGRPPTGSPASRSTATAAARPAAISARMRDSGRAG